MNTTRSQWNNKLHAALLGLGSLALAAGISTAVYAQQPPQEGGQPDQQQTQSSKGSAPHGGMGMHGGMHGRMPMNPQMKEAHDAVRNNDYDAWKTAMLEMPEDTVNEEALTQENFDKLVDAYTLHEQARALEKEVHSEIKE